MNDRVLRTRAAVLMRFSERLSFFRHGRIWSSMVLVCALLAGCAGASAPPLTADRTSPAKADPAAAQAATVQPGAWSNAPVAADSAALQRRRQTIADMVNGDPDFRTFSWVQLLNAKLAGPFEWHGPTIYCASAQLWSTIGSVRTMVIRVERSSNGLERLTGATGGLFECTNANYGPFPELEAARAKMRKAHGLE